VGTPHEKYEFMKGYVLIGLLGDGEVQEACNPGRKYLYLLLTPGFIIKIMSYALLNIFIPKPLFSSE
jgi:hypothetical protein